MRYRKNDCSLKKLQLNIRPDLFDSFKARAKELETPAAALFESILITYFYDLLNGREDL